MKHTPGPWDLQGTRVYAPGKAGPLLATIAYLPKAPGQEGANTRLIAAAPDLLKALESVVRQIEPMLEKQGFAYVGAIQSARAAIAKATGEAA